MMRMFFSVDKSLLSLARRARRRGLSIFSLTLRPGVAGVFLFTTLFGPASGWGQSRASQMLAGVQHDEFSSAAEDGGHFSPERLRARILSLDMMVAAHNARFARLQGRPFAGGAGDDVAPRVFQAALEKFQTAAQMNADVEMRRARFSQKFAAAGGFQYRTFADGKRMWFKNGRVSRIENEKIVDAFGNTHRQDTTEMVYDKRGNLLSSKTETRDANGHMTVKRWQGTYNNVPGRDRLVSFSESTWDPLGNESRLDRTDLVWDAEGKNLLSYEEKATDPYGTVSTRRVWDSKHDKDGNLLSFKEESESKGVKGFREWFGATYKSAGKKKGKDEWQLTSYQEKTTDALGRETTREWGEAQYDDKGALRAYTEKTTGPDGETTVKTWGDAEFDRNGNLAFFRETLKSSSGRETTRVFRNGKYDDHGRVLSYEELTSETDGPSALRVWSGGRYNERNELLSYTEKITDSHGVPTTREWRATTYVKGQPSATIETVTDDQGHATTREWNGRFGGHGRLVGFDEKTTDARGNVSTVTQNSLTYDALGRLIGYDERSSDIFGRPTVSTWRATAFDVKDRAIATVRTDQGEDGRVRRAERSNIAYDAVGRVASYEESLSARGGSQPDATGRQTWTALGYDRHGDLLGFELTSTNARGETETQRRTTTYDNRGRVVGMIDVYVNPLGETQTVDWKALRFDAWGNVDKYTETTAAAGQEKTRVWEGTLDARGLAADSQETITDASGFQVTHQLRGARYDARGRMTDGVRATQRSDYPDVSIVSTTAGKAYDAAGQTIGGTETTRIQGRAGGETINLTTVETNFGGTFVEGYATQTRSTVETTGTWGPRQVHTRDTVESLFGSLGERTDNRTSQAIDAAGALIKESRTTTTRTNLEVDLAGRTLAYEESSADAAAPKARTTTRRVNHYYGNGELSGYAEETTNAFGVTTRVNATDLATDALGQTVQSREKSTQPGFSVKTDETFKTNMRYDLLGRNIGGNESSSTTGPGLSTRSSSHWRTMFDGAGRVIESTSAGERDGVSFENTTRNSAFDIHGRAIDYRSASEGAAGVSDVETTGVQFDEFGRAYKRHEDGWNNGSYSNAEVTAGYDALGREVKTAREGYNGQGDFREETTTQGFNALGQAMGRSTSGWNATEGNYSYEDTGLNYGLTGELLSFDRAKLSGDKKDVSHWASKGVDAAGRSLGFTEVGKSFENGKFINDFTIDHATRAHNGNGQEVAYRHVTTKTYVGGTVETTVSEWKGAYDDKGRQVEFRDEQTITLTENGVTKEATLSRWREGISYYDADGDGHRQGMMRGYDESVFDSATPDKGQKTTVRNMRYDAAGRYLDGETATGEVSRLKDALRRIADVFSGSNLAQTGRNLLAGLERLVANTAQLSADVAAWLKENIAAPGKGFVDSIVRWLGAPGEAPPALSATDVEKLVRAVSEKAGGVVESDVPLGLVPAAKTMGVFDQGLAVTRTKAKAFDALGRAVSWVEETRSMAAPEKPVQSEIRVTYEGESSRLASYAARVVDGEKVNQIFRDKYSYDALGRSTYREVRFEGDGLDELLEAAPSAAGENPPTRALEWAGLSADRRSALVDRLVDDTVQILGRVEIDLNEAFDYDAKGAVVSRRGERFVRGNVFTELGLEKVLPKSIGQAAEESRKAIQEEIASLIAKQETILTGAMDALTQAEKDAANAKETLFRLENGIGPLEKELESKEEMARDALAAKEAIVAQIIAVYGPDYATREEIDRPGQSKAEKEWSEWQSRLAKTEETYVAALTEVAKAHDALEKGREGKNNLEAAFEANLASANEAKEAATAARDAAQKAVNALLGTDLFLSLAGEKKGDLPANYTTDSRGRRVDIEEGAKATVVDQRWYAVVRVRADGRVVRTYVRRDLEKSYVFKKESKADEGKWVEVAQREVPEMEDPEPAFLPRSTSLLWAQNLKGEKTLATIPTGQGQGAETFLASLEEALASLRTHFTHNNFKKLFPNNRISLGEQLLTDKPGPLVVNQAKAQPALQSILNKLSTLIDTTQKLDVASQIAGAAKDTLDIHNKKVTEIKESLLGLDEAVAISRKDLDQTSKDVEIEKARLEAEETRQLSEATDELAAQKTEWTKELAGAEVWINGAVASLPAGFWDTLLEKGEASLNGRPQTLAGLSAVARVRTRLADRERFARLDENRPDGISISWRGALSPGAAATFDGLRRAAQSALSSGSDDDRRVAFGLATDGRLTVSRVGAQTQDAAGRALAQSIDTLEISRQGGDTAVRRTTQSTQGFKYDARGQVIAYERTTHEAGKPDVVERLVGATYDAAGRLIKSDVRLRDPSSGYTGEIQLLTENFSFGADGAPRHSLRTQIKDGQVSAVEDLGLSRTDALGRVVFSLSNNLTTSLDSWKASGGDYAAAPGDRSTTALLNRSFNARGEATSTLRMTSKTGANGAWHTSFESSATAFSPGGQVIASTVKTVEAGRDGASVLFRSTVDRILDVKYDEQGRALRQRTARTENGQTRETWDELDRKYDAFGRLVETHTKTRDALGEITEAFWSGVYGADGRLSAYSQWNIANGQKIEERSVGAPVVDAQGRTIFPTSEVTEWNSDGTESITRSKTESGAVYNLFGQLVSQEVTTKSPLSDGTFSTETKSYTYGYDTAGRQTKTWVDGREEAGGKVRQFNSYNEVLAFDAAGRSRRALSRSTQGALVTERVSLEDIRYDSKGRLIGSRDRVHRSGVDPVTGAELDAYTTEISETQKFDAWNRATDYTQTTLAGALKTVSIVQATYGRDGRVTDQSTTYDEYSLAAGVDHRVHRVVQQTGMTYDGVGNLVDYRKTVTEGDLVSTYTPAALEYDEFGRSVTALERVRDNAGRDEIVGALGTQFNGLGQVVGGQTVTIKGGSALLGDKGLLAKVTERLLAGDLANGQGTQLVADTGLEGIWSTRLLGAAYDAQGRQLYSDSVTDKAGHGFKDVVVDLVLAKGWVGKGTGWWYGQQFANALAKLKAEGAEIVYSKFFHGGGVHRRYCESLISYRKKEAAILESHERTENAVNVFDPFGRALAQTVTAHRGDNTTTTDQWLAYDASGRVAMIMNNVFEKGLNGDGTRFARAFSQSQEFSYDALGRSTSEKTVTWADSQAPYKITTSTTDNISYDKGQRVGWTETTQSNDRTAVDERVITGAGYDGLGRLASYDAAVYEVNNGVRKLQYKDLNVRNSYDALGRLALTLSDRVWGTTESVRVATRKRERGVLVTGFTTVQKAVEEGAGGGGIAGLSEDWTTGRAAVAITYEYSNGGSSLSGMRVRAFGTGTHKEKTVQAAGIRLDHYQKNMRYDAVGRVTGYKLISTQVERYQYYKQGQSGLRRKVKSAWTTGAVTTVSDVEVKEYDGFGRQVHTVVTSQRNDINKTWTRTETIVKSFDDQGRAKDVKRTTDSKMTLPKSSGGLLGGLGGVALGVLLAVSLVGLVVGVIATVASIATGAVVGMGALSANWLGGQRIYSHNVVEQTMAYKADGTVDEAKTKAQTRTLEEKSYMMGQNMGDVFMKVTDIVVAVTAVAIAVGAFFVPGAQAAAIALAEVATAAFAGAYNVMRQGISTHDLGLFGENKDRAEARQNRAGFYSALGQTGFAGFGYGIAKLGDAAKVAKMAEMIRTFKIVSNVALSVGVAAAAGVKGEALWQVAALSFVTSFLAQSGSSASGTKAETLTSVGKSLRIAGESVRQIGAKFGTEKQKTTWMLIGTGLSSSAGGGDSVANGTGAMLQSFLIHEISKKNDGSGATDQERLERNYVLGAWAELGGALIPAGLRLYNRATGRQESLSAGFGVTQEPRPEPTAMEVVRNTLIQITNSLVSPLKAVAGLLYGFLAPSPRLVPDNGSMILSGVSTEIWLPVGGGEKKISFELNGPVNDQGQRVIGQFVDNRLIITSGIASIDGLPIEHGEWIRNSDGSFTPVSLDLRLDNFLGSDWASPPLLHVGPNETRYIEIPSEALGVQGVSIRVNPTDRFSTTDPETVDHGRMLAGGSLIVNGASYPLISARLAQVDGLNQLVGATFGSEPQIFVLNDKEEIIPLNELKDRLGSAVSMFDSAPSRLVAIENRVATAVDVFTGRFNDIVNQFGNKGVSPGLSLPSKDKERPLANYLNAIAQRHEFGVTLEALIENGNADLAFSRLEEYEAMAIGTQKELSLLEKGAEGLSSAVPVLLRSFEVLNRVSANSTVNGRTRVQDVPLMRAALADFKKSFSALANNPLVMKKIREEFAKVKSGVESLMARPADLEVYRKDLRQQVVPQLAPQKALPRGLDWLFNPSGKTVKASAALFGLSEGEQKILDKVVQYFNAVSPLDLAGRMKQAWNYVSTHQVDQDLVAALEFTEELDKAAGDPKADLGTLLAQSLNPVRFMERVYRWVEVNGDQPGGMIGAYSLFTLGVAMTLFEVTNPGALLAFRVMPTVAKQDARVLGDAMGVSRETSDSVGKWLGILSSMATLSAGGFVKNALAVRGLKNWGEFGIKTTAFSSSAAVVDILAEKSVTSWGFGGRDQDLAVEVMGDVLNGGMMALAALSSVRSRRYSSLANRKSAQLLRFVEKGELHTKQRGHLMKVFESVSKALKVAKAELVTEKILAKEIESLYKIPAKNAVKGAPSASRSVRIDRGANPELVQGRDIAVLLAEAQRAGETQRGIGRGTSETARSARTAEGRVQLAEGRVQLAEGRVQLADKEVKFLAKRKRSIGSEIRRIDSKIERISGARTKAEAAVARYRGTAIFLKGISLFAQSDEPLFDGTLSGKGPTSDIQSPYRAGKEALAAQRGAILVPTSGEVRGPFRSLWNRLLGRRETLTNVNTNGPPVVRTNGNNVDIPMAESTAWREPSAQTLQAMAGNDLGFQNGRPMPADNPNLLRSPPNQFKEFLENSDTSKIARRPLLSVQNAISGSRVRFNPMNPGPILPEVAATFRSATYDGIILDKPVALYRVYSDPTKKIGPFWTTEPPKSSLKSIVDNALNQDWGNRATQVVKIEVPTGERIFIGPSASQGYLVGGVEQVFIPRVDPKWEVK